MFSAMSLIRLPTAIINMISMMLTTRDICRIMHHLNRSNRNIGDWNALIERDYSPDLCPLHRMGYIMETYRLFTHAVKHLNVPEYTYNGHVTRFGDMINRNFGCWEYGWNGKPLQYKRLVKSADERWIRVPETKYPESWIRKPDGVLLVLFRW